MEQMDAALGVEALAERYGPMVFRRCRQLLQDEDEAMDAGQDVFVRLLERRERLQARYPSSLLVTAPAPFAVATIVDAARRAATTAGARELPLAASFEQATFLLRKGDRP